VTGSAAKPTMSQNGPSSSVMVFGASSADGAVVTVHLSPSTEIDGAASCSDLDGAAVEIEGRPEADGSVDAGSIDVDD